MNDFYTNLQHCANNYNFNLHLQDFLGWKKSETHNLCVIK